MIYVSYCFFAQSVVVSWKWKQNYLPLTSGMINLNTYGVILCYPTCFTCLTLTESGNIALKSKKSLSHELKENYFLITFTPRNNSSFHCCSSDVSFPLPFLDGETF